MSATVIKRANSLYIEYTHLHASCLAQRKCTGQLEDGHNDMRHRWYFEINEMNERRCVYTAENVDTTLRVNNYALVRRNFDGQFSQFFHCHTP